MVFSFWQSAIIAGIALVGPIVAGCVAIRIANIQISATRNRSFSDARRERIEEAVQIFVLLHSRVQAALPLWIKASQAAHAASQESNADALSIATDQIQSNPLQHEIGDSIGRAATLVALYMEEGEREALENIMTSLRTLLNDPRAKGEDLKSAYLLSGDLLEEFAESTQPAISVLLGAARTALRE